MRKWKMYIIAAAMIWAASGNRAALLGEASTYPAVNVRNYGAKGDGVTDDSEAIKKAAHAARTRISKPSPLGLYIQSGPSLVFPAGEYIISDEIPLNVLEIYGEGRPIIVQKNKDKNIFVKADAWRMRIRNITFQGGKNQIDLSNKNIDTGQIIIEHCRFYAAAGFAIRTDVLSTMVKITDCEFFECHQTWQCKRSDQSLMRDCWITSSRKMKDKAVIENHGSNMTLENVLGVPHTNGTDQRWIDNYGMIRCASVRFGGEGAGFTPVVNFSRYKTDGKNPVPVFVTLENCWIYALANKKRVAAVYLEEMPNAVKIIDCHGFARGVKLVGVSPKLDLKKILTPANKALFNFTFHGNVFDYGGIPEQMLPFTNVLPGVKRKKIK